MQLLKKGADIHNKLIRGLINKQDALLQRDNWWNEVEKANICDEMTVLNLMMMFRTITEKIDIA